MFPVLDLGPIAIQASGLILLLSLMIGIWLSRKFAKNLLTNAEAIENGILTGLLAGIAGARIGFLLQNPSVFLNNPLSLVSLTPSMLNPGFGLLVGVAVIWIMAQKKHLPLWPTLDTISPLILMVFCGFHLANYANGNAYGLPTSLPWGVQLWNTLRHPVQMYAVVLGLAALAGWLLQTRGMKQTGFQKSGVLFAIVITALAFITVIIRAFAAEKLIFLGVDLVQMLAVILLIGSLYLAYHRLFNRRHPVQVFVSLGSNLNPEKNLTKALNTLQEIFKIRRVSGLYRSADVREGQAGLQFLNRMVELETLIPYLDLQEKLKSLEREFGREPSNKDRVPLDLDIITYNGEVFVHQGKNIPDPNLTTSLYIAQPLAEIAPDFRHPGTGQTIPAIIEQIDDREQAIEKITEVENGTTG